MVSLVNKVLLARKVPRASWGGSLVLMESRETRVLLDCKGQVDHQEEEEKECVGVGVGVGVGRDDSEVRVTVVWDECVGKP